MSSESVSSESLNSRSGAPARQYNSSVNNPTSFVSALGGAGRRHLMNCIHCLRSLSRVCSAPSSGPGGLSLFRTVAYSWSSCIHEIQSREPVHFYSTVLITEEIISNHFLSAFRICIQYGRSCSDGDKRCGCCSAGLYAVNGQPANISQRTARLTANTKIAVWQIRRLVNGLQAPGELRVCKGACTLHTSSRCKTMACTCAHHLVRCMANINMFHTRIGNFLTGRKANCRTFVFVARAS